MLLDALAFFPVDSVPEGMTFVRENSLDELVGLVDYFDGTYVSGQYRSVVTRDGNVRFRKVSPRFEPLTWNIHSATTLDDEQRTNNMCESWNNGFKHLVGHANPSLWTVIICLKEDAAMEEVKIYSYERGVLVAKRVTRATVTHIHRIKTLCQPFVKGENDMAQFLLHMSKCI